MTAPAIFSILPMPDDPNELPVPDQPYYVIAANGPLIHKKTFFGQALVPVTELPHLPKLEHDCYLWYDIRPVPAALLGQVWSFFRAVWDRMHTEAMVYLTWHPDHGYRVFVPPQQVSAGHVDAKHDPTHITNGWQNVGSIHSHCNFGAGHSSTDTHDADGHDGLHITIGHVDRDPADWAVMISINKKRWSFKLEDVTDGVPAITPHPEWWHRYVARPTAPPASTWKTPKPPAWLQRHTAPTTPAHGRPASHTYGTKTFTPSEQLEWLSGDPMDAAYSLSLRPGLTEQDRIAYLTEVEEIDDFLARTIDDLASLGISLKYTAAPIPNFDPRKAFSYD